MRKISSKKNVIKYSQKKYKNPRNDCSPANSSDTESNKDVSDFKKEHILEVARKVSKSNSLNDILKVGSLFGTIPNKKVINVMLCDDDSKITAASERILGVAASIKQIDVKIDHCHNGIECLYKIYQESRQNKFYDVLLIDESMPAMKGSLVIKVLKNMIKDKQMRELIIYSVTAYGDESALGEIRKSGCDGIIPKPISKESAIKIISEVLNNM